MIPALVVAALLQVADVWSTRRGLARGGVEKNAFIGWLMDMLGPLWWLPKLALAGLGYASFAGAYLYGIEAGLWAIWAANAVYLALVVRNMGVGE